jgi:hypothetical protein
VFELGTGSPIEHAIITVRNEGNRSEKTGVTSADGTFFISPLSSGVYVIRAVCAGFKENALSGYPVGLSTTAAPPKIGLARTESRQESAAEDFRTAQNSPHLQSVDQDEAPSEALVRWDAVLGTDGAAPGLRQSTETEMFSLIGIRQTSLPMPRQRMPELSPDQILVVFSDAQGEQQDWTLISDPRIIRAEMTGPNGELTGQIIYRSNTEFMIPFSGGSGIANMKFYQPHWMGKEFSLDLLGTLKVNNSKSEIRD